MNAMKTIILSHRVLAAALVVILLLLSTSGFGLALSLHLKDQTLSKHADCGCITADSDGGESGGPASEAFHGDFNPSCIAPLIMPVYAPAVENLHPFEPFRAPPQVFYDLFVPPQNHC
ncbi:hypothetical protein KI811_14975 [Geobacter hydrogenophilus]|nr:hypothetical protein [Geobacter hydrogenophilus]